MPAQRLIFLSAIFFASVAIANPFVERVVLGEEAAQIQSLLQGERTGVIVLSEADNLVRTHAADLSKWDEVFLRDAVQAYLYADANEMSSILSRVSNPAMRLLLKAAEKRVGKPLRPIGPKEIDLVPSTEAFRALLYEIPKPAGGNPSPELKPAVERVYARSIALLSIVQANPNLSAASIHEVRLQIAMINALFFNRKDVAVLMNSFLRNELLNVEPQIDIYSLKVQIGHLQGVFSSLETETLRTRQEVLRRIAQQFYAAFDRNDETKMKQLETEIIDEMAPLAVQQAGSPEQAVLSPIQIEKGDLVWIRRTDRSMSLGYVRRFVEGEADVGFRMDGLVPENPFEISAFPAHKVVPIDDLKRVAGFEISEILRGRGRRTQLVEETGLPFQVRTITFDAGEGVSTFVPDTAPVTKYTTLLGKPAKITIDGKTLSIPEAGQLELGSNVAIRRRGPTDIWEVVMNGQVQRMLRVYDEFGIVINGAVRTLRFTPPPYFELHGVPQLDLRTYVTTLFEKWVSTEKFSADDRRALLEFGRINQIYAYGITTDYGAMKDLVGVAASGEYRPYSYRSPKGILEPGSLPARDGKYFVIPNKGARGELDGRRFEFLLPTDDAKVWFIAGLDEAVGKGYMTIQERNSVVARTYTFHDFIVARDAGKSPPKQ